MQQALNRRQALKGALALTAGLMAAPILPRETSAFTPYTPYPLRRIDIGPNDSIQDAIDYAAEHGANQTQTLGSTEQGGTPWTIVLHPGEYNQSGVHMKEGVNLTSLMERTVLWVADDSARPLITWAANATISGLTIEQLNPNQPALLIEEAIQASVHNCIIGNTASENVPAVLQHKGFIRIFDTDIRKGQMRLSPTVEYGLGNPVGLNLIRSRLWAGNIVISGTYSSLLMLKFCDMDGKDVLSTSTGHVIGHFNGNTRMGKVVNSGTGAYDLHQCEARDLACTNPAGSIDVWGGHVETVSNRTGTITFHPGVTV